MIVCPACKHEDSRVYDSRPFRNTIRRRRQCLACDHRWSTIEIQARDWKPLGAPTEEHRKAISEGRKRTADLRLAEKYRIPVEAVEDFRKIRQSRGFKNDAEGAAQMFRG